MVQMIARMRVRGCARTCVEEDGTTQVCGGAS